MGTTRSRMRRGVSGGSKPHKDGRLIPLAGVVFAYSRRRASTPASCPQENFGHKKPTGVSEVGTAL